MSDTVYLTTVHAYLYTTKTSILACAGCIIEGIHLADTRTWDIVCVAVDVHAKLATVRSNSMSDGASRGDLIGERESEREILKKKERDSSKEREREMYDLNIYCLV